MAITKKTVGRIPVCFGSWYAKEGGWSVKNRVTLYGSEFESLVDNNTVPPAVYDDVTHTVTFNETYWAIISNGTDAWLADSKINDLGTWVESPEWLRLMLDADGKIIGGIKADGSVDWFKGVPIPIKEYISTLPFDTKVDKEEGKGLIILEFSERVSFEDNPEWLNVVIDPVGKIISGVRYNGTTFISKLDAPELDAINERIDALDLRTQILSYFDSISDIENRLSLEVDEDGKVLSYRKADGTKVEELLELHNVTYSKEAEEQLKDIAASVVEGNTLYKGYHLPKYGTANILQETFYLTYNENVSGASDVYVIQDLEDSDANAAAKLTIAFYYVKSSLVNNGGGSYSKYNDGVEGHDIKLDFYAATKVTVVNTIPYVTETLTEIVDPETGDVSYEVNANSIRVVQIVDKPDVRTWPVDKKTEHHCVVDIDFGYYLSGSFYVGVKFQGQSTLMKRKRNFRFTFYKNNTYAKKDKKKIGELILQSGFNLKANWNDSTRVMELILYRLIIQIWEQRDIYDQYPWNKDNTPYTGATGIIKGFPIRIDVGGSFYGLDIFGLKKDEKNYMLDGPETGIFYSGKGNVTESWIPDAATYWEDEMNDEMLQEDIDAVNVLLSFIHDTEFTKENMPPKMDVISWIDYFICMEVFLMFDSTQRNVILYSGADKTKFYPFFYDLDFSLDPVYPYNTEFYQYSIDVLGRVLEPWVKIRDLYWEEIVNRYCKLRDTVLNTANIRTVYKDVVSGIPDEDFANEGRKWGGTFSPDAFEERIDFLDKRLKWLDENYFKV